MTTNCPGVGTAGPERLDELGGEVLAGLGAGVAGLGRQQVQRDDERRERQRGQILGGPEAEPRVVVRPVPREVEDGRQQKQLAEEEPRNAETDVTERRGQAVHDALRFHRRHQPRTDAQHRREDDRWHQIRQRHGDALGQRLGHGLPGGPRGAPVECRVANHPLDVPVEDWLVVIAGLLIGRDCLLGVLGHVLWVRGVGGGERDQRLVRVGGVREDEERARQQEVGGEHRPRDSLAQEPTSVVHEFGCESHTGLIKFVVLIRG